MNNVEGVNRVDYTVYPNKKEFMDGYNTATEEYTVQEDDTAYTRIPELAEKAYGLNYGQLWTIKWAIKDSFELSDIKTGDVLAFEEWDLNNYIVSLNGVEVLTVTMD